MAGKTRGPEKGINWNNYWGGDFWAARDLRKEQEKLEQEQALLDQLIQDEEDQTTT